jgi:arylsulfatase A-like enzyme
MGGNTVDDRSGERRVNISLSVAPNVLLVVFDALRRDGTEPYGAPSGTTPAVADLAALGSALPTAYANASWTLPSHASMFTGLLPRQLGLGQPPDGSPGSARPLLQRAADRLLPNVLHDAGYANHGFSTNPWASQHAGFDIGFDSFSFVSSDRTDHMNGLLGRGARADAAWALEGLRARSDDGAAEVGRLLRTAIERWWGGPTFWFVNLCECHSPYLPPQPWNDLSALERIRAALDAKRYLSFESICLYAAGRREVPEEALERMRHLYRRATAYLDQWLADVLAALDRKGILDETLVIVTSDHGENFGEAGLIAHGFAVNERLIQVPLVMCGPGALSTKEPFSLAELPAAIAAAVGLEEHPWKRSQLPEGVAVAQYDPMAPATDRRVHEFAQRWELEDDVIGRLTAGFTCATDGVHKLVLRNDQELLYDLRSDPDETTPLDPGSVNGAFAALRAALEHPSVTMAPQLGEQASDPLAAPEGELEALERQMKLLGYM